MGAVNYTISPATDIFVINTLSNGFGQIIVVNVLDRETRDFYTITVVARDGGKHHVLRYSTYDMIWNKNTIIYSICGLCQVQAFVIIISTTYLEFFFSLCSSR